MNKEIRTRFAPSPTGYIHIGNVRSAIYPYLIARQNHGQFILRIEDTDQSRFVEGAAELVFDTLKWLGLNWDEGPMVGGPDEPYYQTERKDIYLAWAKKLLEKGLAYADDTPSEKIEEYKKLLIELSGNTKYTNMPLRDFLTEIGVFKKDRTDGSYKLTAGGLLFFGKYNSIISRYPKFQLDYFEKDNSLSTRWNDRISTGDMMYPDLNINLAYKKLTATTNDRFELNDKSAHRLPFKKDLSESIREALVNCLMHAYYDFDSPIVITAYNDFYEFKNPGKMKISIPEFIHGGTSKTRNGTISSLFRRIGMSEKAGSGGPKIFDVSEKYKLKIPEVSTTFDSTIVTIWKVDLLSSYQDVTQDERAILKYIIENESISKNDVIENNLMTEYKFRENLKTLQSKQYIEVIGKGRSTKYVLPRTSSEQYHIIKQKIKNLGDFMTKN